MASQELNKILISDAIHTTKLLNARLRRKSTQSSEDKEKLVIFLQFINAITENVLISRTKTGETSFTITEKGITSAVCYFDIVIVVTF